MNEHYVEWSYIKDITWKLPDLRQGQTSPYTLHTTLHTMRDGVTWPGRVNWVEYFLYSKQIFQFLAKGYKSFKILK